MTQITVQDLRRIAASLEALKGQVVADVHMRSDLRQLKVEMADGTMLVMAVTTDEAGRPHLEVDVARSPEELVRHQLEVGLDL